MAVAVPLSRFTSRRRGSALVVSRMKASAIFGVLGMLCCSSCSHLQRAHDGMGVIEFERQEENGSVNIVPCTLVLSDHRRITLSGGERSVVSVSSGSFQVAGVFD